MSLNEKEKELISLAASVAAGCRPCTEYHVKATRKAGACERGLALAVETALEVRKSATQKMDQWAGQCQGPRPEVDAEFRSQKRQIVELEAVAAAFAVNSAPDLEARVAAARAAGATMEQIREAIDVAKGIKGVAEKHASAVVVAAEAPAPSCCEAKAPTSCGCGS